MRRRTLREEIDPDIRQFLRYYEEDLVEYRRRLPDDPESIIISRSCISAAFNMLLGRYVVLKHVQDPEAIRRVRYSEADRKRIDVEGVFGVIAEWRADPQAEWCTGDACPSAWGFIGEDHYYDRTGAVAMIMREALEHAYNARLILGITDKSQQRDITIFQLGLGTHPESPCLRSHLRRQRVPALPDEPYMLASATARALGGLCIYLDGVTLEDMVRVFGQPKPEWQYGDEEKGYEGNDWLFVPTRPSRESQSFEVFHVYTRHGNFRIGCSDPGSGNVLVERFETWLRQKLGAGPSKPAASRSVFCLTFQIRQAIYGGWVVLLFEEPFYAPMTIQSLSVRSRNEATSAARSWMKEVLESVSSVRPVRLLDEQGMCLLAMQASSTGPKEMPCPSPLPNPRRRRNPWTPPGAQYPVIEYRVRRTPPPYWPWSLIQLVRDPSGAVKQTIVHGDDNAAVLITGSAKLAVNHTASMQHFSPNVVRLFDERGRCIYAARNKMIPPGFDPRWGKLDERPHPSWETVSC